MTLQDHTNGVGAVAVTVGGRYVFSSGSYDSMLKGLGFGNRGNQEDIQGPHERSRRLGGYARWVIT